MGAVCASYELAKEADGNDWYRTDLCLRRRVDGDDLSFTRGDGRDAGLGFGSGSPTSCE